MYALVTGSSKGIGFAIARKFVQNGIHLILNSRNIIELESVRAELLGINPSVKILCCEADLSKKRGIETLSEFIYKECKELDILVNNAGVYLPGNIIHSEEGLLEKLMNANLYSAFYLTNSLLPKLRKSQAASIFNICSIAGLDPYKGGSLYCISKFAMNGFSRCLRQELLNDSIKVTTVYPGATWSDSWKGATIPDSRIMQAEDVAEAIISCVRMSPAAVVEEIIMRPQLGDL
ncbi:MAG: SDR family oxidoreductase [Saprospiraceae bacterium]|nr:SDR family oxidoreductase [Saprospiraceae bacterium]